PGASGDGDDVLHGLADDRPLDVDGAGVTGVALYRAPGLRDRPARPLRVRRRHGLVAVAADPERGRGPVGLVGGPNAVEDLLGEGRVEGLGGGGDGRPLD